MRLRGGARSAQGRPVDSVEVLHPGAVAVGSYALVEGQGPADKAQRRGALMVYDASQGVSDPSCGGPEALRQQCEVAHVGDDPLPGIFDLKWRASSPHDGLLAAACSDGAVWLFAHDPANASVSRRAAVRVGAREDAFVLSVDWDNRVTKSEDARLAASLSDGTLAIVECTNAEARCVRSLPAHSYSFGGGGGGGGGGGRAGGGDDDAGAPPDPAEVWIAAFDPYSPEVLLSGADDGLLKAWDLRAPSAAGPVWVNRQHGAGVCSIQFDVQSQYRFATGSYDHGVRVWDLRNPRKAAVRGPCECDGGVWRLKWGTGAGNKDLLATACMRGGFRVLAGDPDNAARLRACDTPMRGAQAADPEAPWEELAYGIDWLSDTALLGGSFYDAHLWWYDIGLA